jgi:RHS repeat-associated protein
MSALFVRRHFKRRFRGLTWSLLTTVLIPVDSALAFHFPWDQGHDTCRPDAPDPNPETCDKCNTNPSPFVAATGAYTTQAEDLTIPGLIPIHVTRTYHSRDGHNGMFGYGWTFTYGIRLIEVTSTGNDDTVIVRRENGHRDRFSQAADGAYVSPPDVIDALHKNADGTYHYLRGDRVSLAFDTGGSLMSITDPNGNSLGLEYDATGFLLKVNDSQGAALVFVKGPNGKVASVTDRAGRAVHYAYNSSAMLTTVTHQDGTTTQYVYDQQGNLVSITDPRGNVVAAMTYDANGRALSYTTSQGTLALTHSLAQNRVTERGFDGRTRTIVYGALGNITAITNAGGATEQFGYDANGNIVQHVLQNGTVWNSTYDALANRTLDIDPLGSHTSYSYAPGTAYVTAITDPNGNTTLLDYDAHGNMTRITDPEGNATVSAFDAKGLVTSQTDANGQATTTAYDSLGHPLTVRDPLGHVTNYTYDVVGHSSTITDRDGLSAHFSYDPQDRLVRFTDPSGNATTFTYSPNCELCNPPTLLTAIVEADNSTTNFTYDQFGRMTTIRDAMGAVYSATYDQQGRLVSVTDALGRTTRYSYDVLDRLTQKTMGPATILFTYDAVGKILTRRDAIGVLTSYGYDAANRLVSLRNDDIGPKGFAYDSAGQLIARTESDDRIITSSFDRAGRKIAVHYPDSAQDVTYRYDEPSSTNGRGHLTGMHDPSGDTALSYDAIGRLIKMKTTHFGVTYTTGIDYYGTDAVARISYPSGIQVLYNYDANGLLANISLQRSGSLTTLFDNTAYDSKHNRTGGQFGNGLHESRRYDGLQRLTQLGVSSLYTMHYTYDLVGNLLTARDDLDLGRTFQYTYDDLDRLMAATGPWGTETYSYDPAGNRIAMLNAQGSHQYSYTGNRLTSLTGATPTTFVYDADGNIVSDDELTFAYNDDGRLHAVSRGASTVARFTYNGFAQRVVKETSARTTVFHYDAAGRLLEETSQDGTPLMAYIYFPDGPPLALINNQELFYYHIDHLGTPVILTDSAGSVVSTDQLRPFGEVFTHAGTISQNLRFRGHYFDSESGLHYNYQRFYSPQLGRYLTPDPLREQKGDAAYVYAFDNPIRYVDGTGLLSLYDAVIHYFSGGGAVTVPFTEVDIGLTPKDFPGYTALVMAQYKKSISVNVDLKVAKETGSLVHGSVTFVLRGGIESDKCKWSFTGYIGALDDEFDFNALPWGVRAYWKEVVTRIFGYIPFGTKFPVQHSGTRSVTDGGKW